MDFNYSYVEYITFLGYLPYYHGTLMVITIPLFFLFLYVILTQSPKKFGSMKFFIINIAIRNFLNVLIFLLWQPATLLPMAGGFSLVYLELSDQKGIISVLKSLQCFYCIKLFLINLCWGINMRL